MLKRAVFLVQIPHIQNGYKRMKNTISFVFVLASLALSMSGNADIFALTASTGFVVGQPQSIYNDTLSESGVVPIGLYRAYVETRISEDKTG
jgi:uncharacterized membrane protein YjjP (DUF1212 family)